MMKDCAICGYRRTFKNASHYPINQAIYEGLWLDGEAIVPACEEHKDWLEQDDPDFPIMRMAYRTEPLLHKVKRYIKAFIQKIEG